MRMLAGHLAGIRHYEDGEFFSAVRYESVSEALSIFADDPLAMPPGSGFHYSTYGFNLASAVVEAAAGQEFVSYMAENIFGPTGMTQTVADHVVPIISNRSRYYRMEDGGPINSPWVDNSNKWAGGGFLSTSDDLVRFAFAHLTDKYLKPETIAMMWTSQKTTSGEETGYGIGWGVRKDDVGRNIIMHGGGSVGGTTLLLIYPDDNLVYAAVTNATGADFGDLTNDIVAVFLGDQ
jgi:CubicO group peptidase (beta-lactamase class C family)